MIFYMGENILEVVLKARDEASKVIENLGKSVEDTQKKTAEMSKSFAIAGGIITGAGLAGVAVMNNWTSLASDVQKANAQLEHAVIAVSKATKQQFEDTKSLADLLEKKGVLDGDNIKIGLAQLSTFGLSNAAVQKLGGSLSDLAVNQFGVSASGDQLSQSANMIAKALNGQFGVLEKSGIRFTDAQKAIIATGTEMEKVKAINEGFAQNLKYTNEVARQTAEGMRAHLGVQLENIKESLGMALIPIMTKFGEKLIVIAEKINTLDPAKFDLIAKSVLAFTGISLVIGPLLLLIATLPALGAGFALLMGPMGIILATVMGIGLAAVYIVTNWQKLQPMLQPVIDFLKQVFGEVSAGFLRFINDNIPTFMAIWQTMVGVLDYGLAFISGIWNAVWPSLLQLFTGIWTMIQGIFQTIWGAMQVILAVGLGIFTGKWSQAWELMKTGFYNIFNGLKTYFMGWWDSIIGFFKVGLNGLIGVINGAINAVNKAGKGMGVNIPTIPAFENGGWVNETGIALVHKGEYILSNGMLNGSQPVAGGVTNNNHNNTPITNNIYVQDVSDIDRLGQRLAFQLATSGRL
jgi:hypothetical protein